MAIINPTSFLGAAGNAYPAARLRRVMQTLNGDREGVIEPDGLTVTATGPASMNVQVAAGRAWVTGDAITRQGSYLVENDAAVTVGPLGAAHVTLHRIDLVVLRVRDAAPDGGSDTVDEARLEVVQGSPAGSPVPPLVPGSAIPLAEVRVDAAATSIAAGKITDRRPAMTPTLWVSTNTAWSVGGNQTGPVNFTTKLIDTDNMWAPSAPNKITFRRSGTWLVTARARWNGAGYLTLDVEPYVAFMLPNVEAADRPAYGVSFTGICHLQSAAPTTCSLTVKTWPQGISFSEVYLSAVYLGVAS